MCNLDSLYCGDSEKQNGTHAKSDTPISGATEAPGCTTPYKNIDVMMTYSNSISAVDSLYSEKRTRSHTDHNSSKARTYKELPPLPSYYLYHPKNCPLHRGAPPRLSPIGALSPPQRSGAPPSGTAGSCLSSPLFPRSHTLPALAAPLYYPNLYPPIPPRVPPLPPKLYQAPLQSHVASKISLSLHLTLSLSLSDILPACMFVFLTVLCSGYGGPHTFCHFFNLGGFADLKELGDCSGFMYQKAAPCRSSYLHCLFKSAKGLQKGNSCSRVPLITLLLSVFLCLSLCLLSGPSTCCFSFLLVIAWCVEMDTCISCRAQPK